MKTKTNLAALTALSALSFSAPKADALVVMISDLTGAGSPIEDFFMDNFSNVTEIRHGNYANFAAAGSQEALLGTGAFDGDGRADIFVIGRSLGSAAYSGGAADGYNNIDIPFINFTSYTARETGDRLGWHAGGAANSGSRNNQETTVTAAGALILGRPAGLQNFWTADPNFNGIGTSTNVGTGDILATLDGNILAAHWDAGDAPGNPTNADVALFPATRLLLNLDNEPNAGNNGANDFTGLHFKGLQAYVTAIDNTTPLIAVPEPSSALLGLAGLGLLATRRRR